MTTLRYGTPEEVGMSPQRVENLRRLGAKWVEEGALPALVLLVVRRGVIVLHEAWGKLGPGDDAPALTTQAIFRLSSISKVLTAACVMSLVDDGLLGLNRPVQEYIPEFTGEGKDAVLVHHLLTHTSGLDDAAVLPAMGAAIRRAADSADQDVMLFPFLRAALAEIYRVPLGYSPGTEMSYSSAGYFLAGEVIRRVSGMWLHEFARERLFAPLGMEDASFVSSDAHKTRLVKRWFQTPTGEFVDSFGDAPLPPFSATATALDMAIFGQTFLQGGRYGGVRVLSPAGTREMMRNQIPGTSTTLAGERHEEASWSYGWAVKGREKWAGMDSLFSPESVWHSGAGGTFVRVDPGRELVCVFLSVTTSSSLPSYRYTRSDLFGNAVVAAIED